VRGPRYCALQSCPPAERGWRVPRDLGKLGRQTNKNRCSRFLILEARDIFSHAVVTAVPLKSWPVALGISGVKTAEDSRLFTGPVRVPRFES